MNEIFDYVVVGGGFLGCIVVVQFVDDLSCCVLLFEVGFCVEVYFEIFLVDGYKYVFINDKVIWECFIVLQQYVGGQWIFVGMGIVLGGSGLVNGMVYICGDVWDYDDWFLGWQWDDVVFDFECIEVKLWLCL